MSSPRIYDLVERTTKFAENIIDFCKLIKRDPITTPMINQLLRSGTSIGANYHEADEAISKRDFINKISIANKEAKEARYWLRVISHSQPNIQELALPLSVEAQELNFIFSTMIRNSQINMNSEN